MTENIPDLDTTVRGESREDLIEAARNIGQRWFRNSDPRCLTVQLTDVSTLEHRTLRDFGLNVVEFEARATISLTHLWTTLSTGFQKCSWCSELRRKP